MRIWTCSSLTRDQCWWLTECFGYTERCGSSGERSLTILTISTNYHQTVHVSTLCPTLLQQHCYGLGLAIIYRLLFLLCLLSVQQVCDKKHSSTFGASRKEQGDPLALPLPLLHGILCSWLKVKPLLHDQVQNREQGML